MYIQCCIPVSIVNGLCSMSCHLTFTYAIYSAVMYLLRTFCKYTPLFDYFGVVKPRGFRTLPSSEFRFAITITFRVPTLLFFLLHDITDSTTLICAIIWYCSQQPFDTPTLTCANQYLDSGMMAAAHNQTYCACLDVVVEFARTDCRSWELNKEHEDWAHPKGYRMICETHPRIGWIRC